MSETRKVLHLITDLDTGGAERMLHKLLSKAERGAFELGVVSLTDIGPVGKEIEKLAIPVEALGMRRGVPNPLALPRLARRLRKFRPNVIQTWMYHANLVGGLAGKLAAGVPVIWGIRNAVLVPGASKRTTIGVAKVCAWLSSWLPERIVCCSEASRRAHIELGYQAGKIVVIPNGFDLERFKPNAESRVSVRRELGVADDALLIGSVARFDPLKDHRNLVQAARQLHGTHPEVHFVLCGQGITWDNRALAGWIEAAGLRQRFHLLGLRSDIPRLQAAFDLAASSSLSEGFPNVIGESMACGVPCVVTDVGDSAVIVGDTGRVVPPRDPQALALAWQELTERGDEGRRRLGEAARRRIGEKYFLERIVQEYEALYRAVSAREGEPVGKSA